MKAVSQFIVRVFDLIEAEGVALRTAVRGEARRVQATAASMALSAVFLVISIPLLISGLWLMAAGLMWWLEAEVNRPLAAGLTGLLILGVGAGCLSCFKVLAGRRTP